VGERVRCPRSIKIPPVGLYALLVYLSVQLHEMGHWSMAALLGLKFALGFNRWQNISESSTGQKLALLAAGPTVTLLLIVAGFALYYRTRNTVSQRVGLLLVVSNSLIVLIPHLLNLLVGGMGDKGWIAFYLGIPQYVIRLPLALLLVAALAIGFKEMDPEMRKTKWVVALFLILVLIMGLVVSLDKLVWRSYEHGDLLLPIWGISSVTLSVNILFLVIFVVILWKEAKYGY